ncbi:MAG: V-type ATPase subunit [Nanoarchaeota archaeon]
MNDGLIFSDALIAIVILAVLFLGFIITVIIYYRRSVKPLQPYLYLLARLSPREKAIRTKKDILSGQSPSISDLIKYYSQTQEQASIDTLDRVLQQHLQQVFDEISEDVPSVMRTLLQALSLEDEIVLVDALVKQATSDDDSLTEDEIRSLPRKTIPASIVKKAISATSLPSLKQILEPTVHAMYIDPDANEPYRKTDLERDVLAAALEITSKPCYAEIRPIMQSIIDKNNLILSLQLINTASQAQISYIEGGFISVAELATADSVDSIIALLKKSYETQTALYSQSINDPEELVRKVTLSFQKEYAGDASRQKFQHPIRIVRYVLEKIAEMVNVRTTVLAGEMRMGSDDIERMLV